MSVDSRSRSSPVPPMAPFVEDSYFYVLPAVNVVETVVNMGSH